HTHVKAAGIEAKPSMQAEKKTHTQTRLTSVSQFYCPTNHPQQLTYIFRGRHRTHTHTQAEVAVNLFSAFLPSRTVLPPGAVGSLLGARGPSEVIRPSGSGTDRRVLCSSACYSVVGVLSGGNPL